MFVPYIASKWVLREDPFELTRSTFGHSPNSDWTPPALNRALWEVFIPPGQPDVGPHPWASVKHGQDFLLKLFFSLAWGDCGNLFNIWGRACSVAKDWKLRCKSVMWALLLTEHTGRFNDPAFHSSWDLKLMILLGDNRKIKSEVMQRRQYETQDADMIHDSWFMFSRRWLIKGLLRQETIFISTQDLREINDY